MFSSPVQQEERKKKIDRLAGGGGYIHLKKSVGQVPKLVEGGALQSFLFNSSFSYHILWACSSNSLTVGCVYVCVYIYIYRLLMLVLLVVGFLSYIFMSKQCVKRCGRRVAPSFLPETQLAQEQLKNCFKKW